VHSVIVGTFEASEAMPEEVEPDYCPKYFSAISMPSSYIF
jgi:hypothetical protein